MFSSPTPVSYTHLDVYKRQTLACSLLMIIVGFLVCGYARKQLGGMSGDIAGYTISITELAGILMLAII